MWRRFRAVVQCRHPLSSKRSLSVGRSSSSSSAMPDGVCTGFEPQNYLRDRCKKCFRLKSKHDEQAVLTATASTSTSTLRAGATNGSTRPRRPVSVASAIGPSEGMPPPIQPMQSIKKEKRRSWRERSHVTSPDEGADQDVPDTSDTISMASFKSANSKGLSSAKSLESVTSANDTKSMVTAVSGDSFDDKDAKEDRAMTPTESEYASSTLKTENQMLHDEIDKLKNERQRLLLVPQKTSLANGKEATLVEQLQDRLLQAESLIQDYRDENTALKAELRAPPVTSSTSVEQKLKETESLADELLVENETLKSEVRELQTEIEEMQDQYREEEIEEFRELQRELELNAKNCRVLQFKLRKAERQREGLEGECELALNKLAIASGSAPGTASGDLRREKELESELRIAKEVSVRLHNELETAEEKRCKLEDDVFYYKEKCRELQTQTKWRDARTKAEQMAKRHSQELLDAAEDMPIETLRNELRDYIERESDLREQLKFTEDNLTRARNNTHDLENENEELLHKLTKLSDAIGRGISKRPPMTRSASEGQGDVRLDLANAELDSLSSKCITLERKNTALTTKMLQMEIDLAKKLEGISDSSGGFQLNVELEKDIAKMITKIHELEKRNTELTLQLKKQSSTELRISSTPGSPVIGREKSLQIELRNEQEKRRELETEISEYKSLIAKSENQKLIAMATKVELLQNQLMLANDRCTALHKKATSSNSANDAEHYADSLRRRCEELEKQLSDVTAAKVFKRSETTDKAPTPPTSDEIEHCCVVLASVEAHTNRLCKLMDKLDASSKDARRRSLSQETSTSIVAELANVLSELGNVKDLLETHKTIENSGTPVKKATVSKIEATNSVKSCTKCDEHARNGEALKEEIVFYKKKNKELTNQVLQTEDRWSREIEKQTHGYRTQIHALEQLLSETRVKFGEHAQLQEDTLNQLAEKKSALEEERVRVKKLQADLDDRQKMLQILEKERTSLREWEIKYRKLEKLFDQEKEKFDSDRARIKADTAVLKKRTDEAVADLDKLRYSHQKRETMWNDERRKLEKEMNDLRDKVVRRAAADGKSDSGTSVDEEVPSDAAIVQVTNYKVTKFGNESSSELRNKLTVAERKADEFESKVVDLRIAKEELESEMSKMRIAHDRERDAMAHKLRQDDKVKVVELDALQSKFTSRMAIMENTNKSLHSQLVQARRERDHGREAVANYEKRIEDEQRRLAEQVRQRVEAATRADTAVKRIQALEAEVHRLTVELAFSKDAHKADKKLWGVEKAHYNKSTTPSASENSEDRDRRITEDALRAAESVQKQYAEYQQLYASEVDRLNGRVKELQAEMTHKQFEMDKNVKELHEQIKVLEIDQRNLTQSKEMQSNAREVLQADQERLLQIVQQAEIQKLTRKYKVAAVIDQLNGLPERTKIDHDGVVAHAIGQLSGIRDEDCQAAFTSNDLDLDNSNTTTDIISQSSASAKSTPYMSNKLIARSQNPSSYSLMTVPNDRSYSIDSTNTWGYDTLGSLGSPFRRGVAGNGDAASSYTLSTERVAEYDKEGRIHLVPKSIARSSSYDKYGSSGMTSLAEPSISTSNNIQTKSTSTWTTEDADLTLDGSFASRTGSVGTNVLYKIRREELSKGTTPSVRSIAKAFESMDPRTLKRGLFSIRKSRSVDTSEQNRQPKPVISGSNTLRPTPLNRNTNSMSHIELGPRPIIANPGDATLPRNRNPFKNMVPKLVDRVRRSLSRSRQPSSERPQLENSSMSTAPLATAEDFANKLPPYPTSPPPPHPTTFGEKNTSPTKKIVKTKKVVVKKKTSAVS